MALFPRVKGFIFVLAISAVLYFSGMFFMPRFLPLLLLPWGVTLSHKAHNIIACAFFKLPPSLLELVFGVRVKICGDGKKVQGPCLLIMNHRTRFDWMFLWCYLLRMGDLYKLKIVLKESIKKIPVLGWTLQSLWFIFVSREWKVDEKRMKGGISWFNDTSFPVQLLFFPEGTDLSPSNKEKGHQYAEKNNLPKYDYVLHPRTKGFALCVQELRKFREPPTLVDISVGYVGDMPQNESHIYAGQWPSEIHFHARQHPLSALPADEQGLNQWLKDCWEEKERKLKVFYSQNRFSAQYLSDHKVKESFWEMKKILAVWSLFFAYIGYNFMTNYFYWYFFPLTTTLYLIIAYTIGLDTLFIKRDKLFRQQ